MGKIFAKILLFFTVIGVVQITLFTGFNPRWVKFPELFALREIAKEPNLILYFGDSVINDPAPADRDNRNLAERLEAEVGQRVINLSRAAHQMEMYADMSRFFLERGGKARAVVAPINLRAYSPYVDDVPHYQFPKEKVFLRYGANPLLMPFLLPLLIFKAFDIASHSQPKEQMKAGQETAADGKKHQTREAYYETIFGYELTREHRHVRAIRYLLDLFKDTDTYVMFYLTPINFQPARKHADRETLEQLDRNIALILEATGPIRKKAGVLNMAFALPSERFHGAEHIDEMGKTLISGKLAKQLRSVFEPLQASSP